MEITENARIRVASTRIYVHTYIDLKEPFISIFCVCACTRAHILSVNFITFFVIVTYAQLRGIMGIHRFLFPTLFEEIREELDADNITIDQYRRELMAATSDDIEIEQIAAEITRRARYTFDDEK